MRPLAGTILSSLCVAAAMSAANTYSVTDVAIASSVSYTYAGHGINSSGQIVGSSRYVTLRVTTQQGFLWNNGATTPLSIAASANAINASGQVVGQVGFTTEAYLYTAGNYTNLGFLPGGTASVGTGINDSGEVVGYASTQSSAIEAFSYSSGVMTGLGFLPGGTQSWATGVNASGQVVGYGVNSSGHNEAFLYSGGTMTGLGTLPGYTDSVATAVNNSGQVVGYATNAAGATEAFLYSGGTMTDLGTLPGFSSAASAINSNGQVVGWLSQASPTNPGQQVPAGAFLASGGQLYDLNTLVPAGQELGAARVFVGATGISDSGAILANSGHSAYLLTAAAGEFVPVTPCRIADTRIGNGAFGGPWLSAGGTRTFVIPESVCGIPATAAAYSLNVTVVPHGPLQYLTVWPAGQTQPPVSTLNSMQGNVVANAALVAAGQGGGVSVYATDATDLILDIDGYFGSTGSAFYPVEPCRVADTRGAASQLGGPSLTAGTSRDFPILSSGCGLPAAATAYSMNVTVVPQGLLEYLTTWPAGQPQPFVSTLNSFTGKVVANAALVPSGLNGATSVYVTNPTDVILDVNGYFAPPSSPGGLTFYAISPCRVADTRQAEGPFGGPELTAGSTRSFPIPASACSIPAGAAAYAFNVTVVPSGGLGFLTAWPAGSPQPNVSTLNSWDGTVVANAAIVPAGTGGAINVFVNGATHVILDINGYFAP